MTGGKSYFDERFLTIFAVSVTKDLVNNLKSTRMNRSGLDLLESDCLTMD